MRNGGLQQLIVLALFVVVALVDLLGRWVRSRAERGGAPGPGDDAGRGNGPEGGASRPMPWPTRDAPPVDAPPAERRPPRSRQPSRERPTPAAARAVPPRGASAPSPPARTAPRARSAARAALDAAAARRAIVAMTILGPCRALEPER
jgi:hypothetical protein